MKFIMECVDCGNSVVSPDGRNIEELQECCELIIDMGLRCRKCDGLVVGRVAPEGA